ncbi:annexin [Aquimarina algiphila]|uniref:Annexin n=1 Tax=Aquimarina algiphila TaxID=2047982 RepID=A0A554VA45_9FLAO|nr:annexin [Aquimarina algiphila]TSE02695.1 annexin [Aquimarina algiphila]
MALPAAALAVEAIKNRPKISVSKDVTTVLLASGLGVGVFFAVRALVRKFKRNNRERHALQPGNPANFAIRLKMAFENDNAFGWGTDEEVVFDTIEQIPSASMMRKVERAYKDLYGNNLSADLANELSTEEFAIAQEIINSKT